VQTDKSLSRKIACQLILSLRSETRVSQEKGHQKRSRPRRREGGRGDHEEEVVVVQVLVLLS
jgi:hypothetical protein